MNATRNDLGLKSRMEVCDILNLILADLFDLYSQTKQAHWTVRGKHFYSLHKLFDDLAGVVDGQLDPLAERITALGGTPQGTIRQASTVSRLPEYPSKLNDDLSHVSELIIRWAQAANTVRKAIDTTTSEGDAVTADLLTGMAADLDKGLWFLEAHTGN